jgi:perosamine synthetase
MSINICQNIKQDRLALDGGERLIKSKFRKYNTIGMEERGAVDKVMQTGVLSQFLGCWDEDFYGGSQVRQLESFAQNYFGVKHAVSVNSWTSGLMGYRD